MSKFINKSFMSRVAVHGALPIMCAIISNAHAGNAEMVEERVKTLDRINKEAVNTIPDIPVSGRVQLEAEGTQHDDIIKIEVKRYKIIPIEERSIQLEKQTSDTVDRENQNEG